MFVNEHTIKMVADMVLKNLPTDTWEKVSKFLNENIDTVENAKADISNLKITNDLILQNQREILELLKGMKLDNGSDTGKRKTVRSSNGEFDGNGKLIGTSGGSSS